MAAVKTIKQVVQATVAHEGAGFLIHRPFPSPALPDLDPFLLVDEMGPIDYKPGEAKGAPDHPHRGFETITYLLAGEMEHADSAGHAGTLRPGDLQWMTAGSGVIHAEMPSTAFQKSGGRMHGFQLWVNLAAKDKRMEPRYQELSAIGVPQVVDAANGVTVKVLSGRYGDVAATVQTQQPVLYLDVALAAGGLFTIDLPEGQTSFAYVFAGEALVGEDAHPVATHQLALFSQAGSALRIRGGTAPSRLLLLAAPPLKEPVARYGPFVMNTAEEVREAFRDYQAGRFATIKPAVRRA